MDEDDPGSFEFLDPRHVIRAEHLIPSFDAEPSQDGEFGDFYVNMCVYRQ